MSRRRIRYICITIITIILLVIIYLRSDFHSDKNIESLPKQTYVCNKDTLKVLLYAHSSDYFMFRSTPIGFQYELIKQLAKALHKTLDLTVNGNPDEVYSLAFSNQYDIVAMDFKKNFLISQLLTLSIPHSQSHPVLIERVPDKNDTIRNRILYIPAQFSTKITTDSLEDPDSWTTAFSSEMTTEDLFDLLHNKKMDYIVSDYQTAITLLPFYQDLQMSQQLGEEFDRTWVLNDQNTELNQEINQWLEKYKQTKTYTALCKKYFSPHSQVLNYSSSKSHSKRISPYDRHIKKYAKKYGLDWRLVTAIMYHESKFKYELRGMGGSFGLMQMMPSTGASFGVNASSSPEDQIRAGCALLSQIQRRYKKNVTNEDDLLHFVCATYNAGAGHILDAQRLCEKYGEDKYSWNSVAKYLELKSESQYYNDPVVKLGYYPGRHTVRYADKVIDRYHSYQAITK